MRRIKFVGTTKTSNYPYNQSLLQYFNKKQDKFKTSLSVVSGFDYLLNVLLCVNFLFVMF